MKCFLTMGPLKGLIQEWNLEPVPAKFSSRFFLSWESLFGLFLLGCIFIKAEQSLLPVFFCVTVPDEKAFLQCLDYT